jgi:hypothetical protein
MTLRLPSLATLTAILAVKAGAAQAAGRLGGGQPLEVSLGRIVAALVICVVVAVLAVLLLRQRSGRIDLRGLFSRLELRTRVVEVVETRRLSLHGDICVVRHAGREYLLIVMAGSARVLREQAIGDSALEPACE